MKNLRDTKLTGHKKKRNSRIKIRFGVLKRKVYLSRQNLRSSETVFKKELSSCTWTEEKEQQIH